MNLIFLHGFRCLGFSDGDRELRRCSAGHWEECYGQSWETLSPPSADRYEAEYQRLESIGFIDKERKLG